MSVSSISILYRFGYLGLCDFEGRDSDWNGLGLRLEDLYVYNDSHDIQLVNVPECASQCLEKSIIVLKTSVARAARNLIILWTEVLSMPDD